MSESRPKLTERQRRFVAAYGKEPNGKKAAIAAGYSEHSAEVQASRLLRDAKVRDALNKSTAKVAEKLQVSRERILEELLRIATVDLRQAYDESGNLKKIHEMPEDVARAMSGVETAEIGMEGASIGHTRKAKFWDKNKALELLGKHLRIFADVVQHEGHVTLGALVRGSLDDDGEPGE